ncbi:hypothetical protein [Actinomyces oris]|uniref:hypothetical protein n=1 Tax=Actinomyces oris TaxID=544580 RepID=UPI000AA559AA|nr:hypothetical protein [Actinomyces oris]
MAAMDRDTFIPLGTSIVKLLLLAFGQGALATAVGEGAGLLAKYRRTLEIGGNRAVFAEKIADDTAKQLLREHQGISEADWHVAARQTATLIDRLSKEERLAAGYNWEELRRTLLDLGGTDLRSDLADESARQAFDWVLEVACQRIADCFTEKEALASILESVEEVRSGIQRLAERPAGASQTRAVVADHMEVVRDLAPDPLEDRERELAELETFVRGSQDTWYAMEAGMISGKTALMSSFALNPPSDMHIVSFFTRRIGGDGNDWRSFSFVAGAQLAEILGDEYTERASDPASQDTEFRQLLRRAATACQSDKNPRPLVLVIDGVDEDSYYERPDDAAAKSILSLLPRHLPEGVKLVTACRPNPRMPEDIVCNASRLVASLEPSPIAHEKINQKDIETFFKSDLAVDIGAFLAACGGSLTVDELRQLIARRRHIDNVPSRDVKACVDHSPGRMLMRVNSGFSKREIPSYALGHDAVTRAVLREVTPGQFGENDGVEDPAWWAQVRDDALNPYLEVILKWVVEKADEGWGRATPSYMLSDECFDLMLNRAFRSELPISIVFNKRRYDEISCRSGLRHFALKAIDRDCRTILEYSTDRELSESVMKAIYEVLELRESHMRESFYSPGILELYVKHFNADLDWILDAILLIDEPRERMDAFREVMDSAHDSRCYLEYLKIAPEVFRSLALWQKIREEVLSYLVSMFVIDDCSIKYVGNEDSLAEIRTRLTLLSDALEALGLRILRPKFECLSAGESHEKLLKQLIVLYYRSLRCVAESIDDTDIRAQALSEIITGLTCAGQANEALTLIEMIDSPLERVNAFVDTVNAFRRNGMIEQAQDTAGNARNFAKQVRDVRCKALALGKIAGLFAECGMPELAAFDSENAMNLADSDINPEIRSYDLLRLLTALIDCSLLNQARVVAEKTAYAIENIYGTAEQLELLGSLVSIVSRGGLVEETHDAAEIIIQISRHISSPIQCTIILSNAANALLRVGLIGQAGVVSRKVNEAAQKAITYAESRYYPRERAATLAKVARALVDVGLIGQAGVVSRKVNEAAQKAITYAESRYYPRERAATLVKMARALVEVGLIDEAKKIAESARCVGQLNDYPLQHAEVLVKVVDSLVDVGLIDLLTQVIHKAVQVADEMSDSRSRNGMLYDLTIALANGGQAELAKYVGEQIDSSRTRAEASVNVVSAFVTMGMYMRAARISEGIDLEPQRSKAYSKIVMALISRGRTADAEMLAKQSCQIDEQSSEPLSCGHFLVELSGMLVSGGIIDLSIQVAEQISIPELRINALVNVVKSLIARNQKSKVDQVSRRVCSYAKRVDSENVREHAFASLSRVLAEGGYFELSHEIGLMINENSGQALALSKLAISIFSSGNTQQAREVFLKACGIAEEIDHVGSRAEVLANIAGALVQTDMLELAQDIANRSQRAVEMCVAEPWREQLQARIARVLADAGFIEQACLLAKLINDSILRVEVLIQVVQAMIDAGSVKTAYQFAEKIRDNLWICDSAIFKIADQLTEDGCIEWGMDFVRLLPSYRSSLDVRRKILELLVRSARFDDAANEIFLQLGISGDSFHTLNQVAACNRFLARFCCDTVRVHGGSLHVEKWMEMARRALIYSWLYGESLWDSYDVLLLVAPEFAERVVLVNLLGLG